MMIKLIKLTVLKNVLIVLLAFSAVFWTGQLWFEQISNRNFFYILLETLPISVPLPGQVMLDEAYTSILPRRIITNIGSNTFDILYEHINVSERRRNGDQVLHALHRDGEFVASGPIENWAYFLDTRALIFDYGISMPAEAILWAYEQRANPIANRVQHFDSIYMLPSRSEQRVSVFFLDNERDVFYQYNVADGALAEQLMQTIERVRQTPRELFYFSSVLGGIDLFTRNTYIPVTLHQPFVHPKVEVTFPYRMQGGALLVDPMEEMVRVFFGNRPPRFAGRLGENFAFSNEHTVVKYFPYYDVLEYVTYRTSTPVATSFISDYQAAMLFLHMDATVVNDFFLAGFSTEAERRTFYFDFVVGNRPVYMPPTHKMRHAMEITVENGRVVRYRVLAQNYHVNENVSTYSHIVFSDPLDRFFAEGNDLAYAGVQRLELAFKARGGLDGLALHWFIQLDDTLYVKYVNQV